MTITDGANYTAQVKTYEQIEAEVFIRFLNRRKISPRTGEVKDEFVEEFAERLLAKIDSHFEYLEIKHRKHLWESDLDEPTFDERANTFRTQAARVKAVEHSVKAQRRIASLVRIPVVQVGT